MFKWINAAVAVQDACRRREFPFAFIGGVAVQRWGEPRVTADVNITLFTGFGHEEKFIDALLTDFSPRVENAAEFALSRRVLLLQTAEGIGVDIALGGLPYESLLVQRASYAEYLPGIRLNTCSAEDLIVLKTFSGRPRDWLDVESVVVRQSAKLNWAQILSELPELLRLKESPEALDRLKKLRADCEN